MICDLGTVLNLRVLHSFTYLENNDTVYWYSHILGLVYRIALQHSDYKKEEEERTVICLPLTHGDVASHPSLTDS